jgi:hypothetical protein
MRKFIVLMVMFVMVVALLPVSTAAAGSPTDVAGTIFYTPYPLGEPRIAGGNTFMNTTEDSRWIGSFVGSSFDECSVIVHRSGRWNYNAIAYFQGSFNGVEGGLTMHLSGSKPDADSMWTGRWVILEGSGGLQNLRGQGSFEGYGAPDFFVEGGVEYKGKVHFAPAG